MDVGSIYLQCGSLANPETWTSFDSTPNCSLNKQRSVSEALVLLMLGLLQDTTYGLLSQWGPCS